MELTNYTYFKENHAIVKQDITIENDKISVIKESASSNESEEFLVPGFIDLQIYGAAGKLFSVDPSVESLSIIEDDLLKNGTTGFLICAATNTPDVFNQCIAAVKAHRKEAKNCLGLHLEGPYLNVKRKGAHIEEFIRKADLDEVKALLDFGDGVIKMITIAPELQDDKVIQYLLDHKVVVSLGHSDASFEQATAAYNRGVQSTTHLFNAMTPIHHRTPGIPTAVFNHDKAMASIIADGYHVDFEVVKFSQRMLKDRLFLITDAVTACSIGPYQHQLIDGRFVMPDGTLSGSSLTMLQGLQNCVNHCEISLQDAINMCALNPAKLMGLDHLMGKVEVGYQANLLVLDKALNLKSVIFNGNDI